MAKRILFCLISVNSLLCFALSGQNIINPYQDYNQQQPPKYPILGAPPGNNLYSLHPDHVDNMINGWTGEYEIALIDHFWQKDPIIRSGFVKSVIVEAASFPFMPACAVSTTGCQDAAIPPVQRNLMMPWGSFNSINQSWLGGLLNRTPVIPFELSGTQGQTIDHMTLVSAGLTKAGPIIPAPLGDRYILPHTVLKHTVRLHCGTDINDPVISSFTFYYDLTRGRLRWYPFTPDNLNSNAQEHDLMIRPILHIRPNWPGSGIPEMKTYYDDAGNNDWYVGGTIPYFPCDEIPVNACPIVKSNFPVGFCNGTNPEFASDYVTGKDYDYVYPAPYTLTSALIFGPDKADELAGYIFQSNQFIYRGAGPNSSFQSLRHKYFIDQPLDLTILNPDEKVIYNPSEVHITASDLVFPSYYTFKTVRGVYPTEAEVLADYTAENGGAYIDDLRDVPVRTDLRTDVTGYPNDPNTDDHSVYASIYYLEPGSKLTVEKCVKIFDAYFEVSQGATMIFNDYSQMFGLEDKSYNSGRYKVRCDGGAVLRNYAQNQYVQNGIITQTDPLHYIAYHSIEAGDAVDPNSDQPQGIYDVQAGADVTFEAGDVVHLANGFQVSGGNFSAYTNNNIPDLPVCYDALRKMPSLPKDKKHIFIADNQEIAISPNPSATGLFSIRFKHQPAGGELTVYNMTGVEVKRINNVTERQLTVSLEGFARGMYLFRYYDRASNMYLSLKAVYE